MCAEATGEPSRVDTVATAASGATSDGAASVIDLGTRHLAPSSAAAVASLAGERAAAGADAVAHKIDSTLRGNWAVELVARQRVGADGASSWSRRSRRWGDGASTVWSPRTVSPSMGRSTPRRGAGSSRPAEHLRAAGAPAVAEVRGGAALERWLDDARPRAVRGLRCRLGRRSRRHRRALGAACARGAAGRYRSEHRCGRRGVVEHDRCRCRCAVSAASRTDRTLARAERSGARRVRQRAPDGTSAAGIAAELGRGGPRRRRPRVGRRRGGGQHHDPVLPDPPVGAGLRRRGARRRERARSARPSGRSRRAAGGRSSSSAATRRRR